ncbi:phytoene desaturase family protein [Klugiella xanthotipulae]|uniref:phytoene desaturase family protein n=1 Tax=Klugiella xanthotipulae TaxID=244735 RepID=UPI0031CEFDEA
MTVASNRSVVVIGGGIAGLATAGLLARDGHSVTLLEKNATVGGRTNTWEKDGFRFDVGPSWYLMPEVFDHFFRLMGTSAAEQLELVKLDPGYRVIFEEYREPVDIVGDRERNRRTFERIEPGSGRNFDRYVESARDTYAVAVEKFLYTNFETFSSFRTPAVLRRAGKLVRLLLQPLNSFASRYFSDPRLLRILGYPAVFLGSSPFQAPAMYHLMSHLDLTDGVYYPQGGFYRLIEAMARLAEDAGVTIVTGAEVTEVTTTTGGWLESSGRSGPVVTLATGVAYADAAGSAQTLDAEVVVSAADLHHTETALLPPELQTRPEKSWEKAVPGPGTVLVFLGVEGELPQLQHHTLFFAERWQDNFEAIYGPDAGVAERTSLYVCQPSVTDPAVAPAGSSNLFVLVPVPSDPGLGGEGDARVDEIAHNAIDQIAEWAGIPDLRERIVVQRAIGPRDFERDYHSWRGTALGLAHTTGQSAFFRGKNESARVGNLYYAGATTVPGIGLPMCLISAELVLKRLRGDRTDGPVAEPKA